MTTAKINNNWGIVGSTPPKKNWPIYVKIAATFVLMLFGGAVAAMWLCHYALRKPQPALLLDEARDLVDPLAGAQVGKEERPRAAHALRLALHRLQ